MSSDRNRILGISGVIAASILWSSAGILIKLVNWSPIPIAGTRSLIAAILIFIYLKKPQFTFSKAQIIAALSLSATMILFVIANKMTTAANAIVLQYTAPVFVAIFSFLVLKEKVRRLDWLVIAVVLAGLSLFFLDDMSTGNLIGNLLGILSGFTFAVTIIALRYQKEGSPMESTLLGNFITFLVALPFICSAPVPDVKSMIGLILLGIFQLGFAYILFANAIKYVTALEGTLFNVVEPLCNPIWVFLFVGEAPSRNALIGGIIVLTAVTIRSIFSANGISGASQMGIEIKTIDNEAELRNSLNIIRESFITVANEYKLTRENARTNAAFIEFEDLMKMKANGVHMFGVYKNEIQIGFFTVEKNGIDLYYLNKLCVLPEHRHNAYGEKILDFVFKYVKQSGGEKISIGIINENLVLKNWYIKYGFTETAIKNYPHLPFEVCLMEKEV